jgi:hypothetical protein
LEKTEFYHTLSAVTLVFILIFYDSTAAYGMYQYEKRFPQKLKRFKVARYVKYIIVPLMLAYVCYRLLRSCL